MAYGLDDATAICFSKIQIGLTFLVPAYRVVPDKGPLNGCCCSSFATGLLTEGTMLHVCQ